MGCNWPQAPVSSLACRSAVAGAVELWTDSVHLCGCFTCSYWTLWGLWQELRVRVFCLRVSVLSVHVAGEKAVDPQWANISLQRHSCHAKVKLFAKRFFFCFLSVMSCEERRVGQRQCSDAETLLTALPTDPFFVPLEAWSDLHPHTHTHKPVNCARVQGLMGF